MIKLRVYGMPAPQGSKKAYAVKGRPVIVDDNPAPLRAWRSEVAAEARIAMGGPPFGGAVEVACTFVLPRPLAHYSTGKNRGQVKSSAPLRPSTRPDVDKLARAVLDALTGIAWVDDGQVADLYVGKVYQASPAERPGAVIEIRAIGED